MKNFFTKKLNFNENLVMPQSSIGSDKNCLHVREARMNEDKNYTDFPELINVYLEDSFVLGIQEESDFLSLSIEAVLTPENPNYHPPLPGEQYCYMDADLVIDGATSIH